MIPRDIFSAMINTGRQAPVDPDKLSFINSKSERSGRIDSGENRSFEKSLNEETQKLQRPHDERHNIEHNRKPAITRAIQRKQNRSAVEGEAALIRADTDRTEIPDVTSSVEKSVRTSTPLKDAFISQLVSIVLTSAKSVDFTTMLGEMNNQGPGGSSPGALHVVAVVARFAFNQRGR
ncbi:MAG: hypothetical protein IH825_08045 [Candidatus Marinimicrobia bacterium]|nr:hypothetical protein [Candidatus Neomarinimicrobiota bacterium]